MRKANKLWLALLLTVLVAALLAVGFTAAAQEEPVAQGYCGAEGHEEDVSWTLDSEGTLTISGVGPTADYTWSTNPWYAERENVKAAVIEEGVTTIGDRLFALCNHMTDVSIPDSVESIGYSAFLDCDSLTDFTVPDTVMQIVSMAFQSCDNLENVVLPQHLAIIDNGLFIYCINLRRVDIPASVQTMKEDAFEGCDSISDFYYGGTVENWLGISIYSDNPDFEENAALYGVTIHYVDGSNSGFAKGLGGFADDEGNIFMYSFFGDGTLYVAPWEQDLEEPIPVNSDEAWSIFADRIKALSIGAGINFIQLNLGNYPNLRTVYLEKDYQNPLDFCNLPAISSIYISPEHDTYADLNGVVFTKDFSTLVLYPQGRQDASYTIPDGVTTILDGAFALKNGALQTLILSKDVADITPAAFKTPTNYDSVFTSVSAIVVSEENPLYAAQDGVLFSKDQTTLLYYPFGKDTNGYRFPDCVTAVGSKAFPKKMQVLTIPVAIPDFAADAFSAVPGDVYYEGLEQTWNETVTNRALLNAVVHFNNDPEWDHGLYRGTCGAEEGGANLIWRLDDADTLIISGTGAMANYRSSHEPPWSSYYKKVNNVVIEDGVTSIGSYAFYNYYNSSDGRGTNLRSVTIADSISSIGKAAFFGCCKLTSVTLPPSLTEIADDVFSECTSLSSVTIPQGVTRIGFSAFALCNLKSVVIPEGVQTICGDAFGLNYSLVSVTLPASLETVQDLAFESCNELRYVFYAGSEAQWENVTIYGGTTGGNWWLTAANIHYNATDHIPGEPVRENEDPATCTAAGSYDEVVYCTQCDYEFSRNHVSVDPLNHKNAQNAAATEATATEHGFTAGVYCPDCETWLSGHEVIHNHLGAQTIIKEPTETEEGIVDIVCTVCGEHGQYTASKTEPKPDDNGGNDNGSSGGFWQRITSFTKGIIDWFLRLFKWFG